MGGKAKRAREKKRMLTRTEVLQRVGTLIDSGELLSEDNDATYNSCNLNSSIFENHDDKCDGSCNQLDKWEVAIVYEKEMIRNAGADPDRGITPNVFVTEVKIDTLIQVLQDLDIVSEEVLTTAFRKKMYETLHGLRVGGALEEAVANARRQAARQQLVIPGNGRQQ